MGDLSHTSPDDKPEVNRYSPTPYTDASWAALNPHSGKAGFAPLTPEAVAAQQAVTDSFFADYTDMRRRQRTAGPEGYSASGRDGSAGAPGSEEMESVLGPMTEEHIREIRESAMAQGRAEEQQVRERLIEEARGAAQEEARRAAQAEFDAQSRALQESMSTTLEDIKAQAVEHVRAVEEKAADLAVKIARKLIGAVAEGTKEHIMPLVKEAVTLAGSTDVRKIRVSPRDYEFIQGMKAAQAGDSQAAPWVFEADDSIRIGCVVETSSGDIDFDLEKAWERIRDQIVGKGKE